MAKARLGMGMLALALVACSGGGTSGGGGSGLQWSGVVLDGYIEGALVCLDLNDNQGCDAEEPQATTGVNGVYSLALGSTDPAQLSRAHLVVQVPDTARDSDDHGRMLRDVGQPAYVMMSPVAGFLSDDGRTLKSAVVTPLTTMISYEMLKNPSQSDLRQIENTVKQSLARLDTSLMDDYLARMTPDHALALQARAIAIAAAHGQKVLKLAGLDDRVALLGAYAYARKNAFLLVGKTPQQIMNEVHSSQIVLGDEARQYTNSTGQDVAALLKEGLYAPICLGNCTSGAFDGYQKSSTLEGRWRVQAYAEQPPSWQASTVPDDGMRYLSAAGWQPLDLSGTVTADGTGRVTWTRAGLALQVSARAYDLAALDDSTIAKIPKLDEATLNALKNQMANTFPPGSKSLVLQATTVADSYRINVAPSASSTAIGGMARLEQLETAFATAQAAARNTYLTQGLQVITFGGDGQLTLWGDAAASPCQSACRSPVGQASYAIRTVQGQRMLVTDLQEADGRLVFAEHQGRLVAGIYSPQGTSQVLGAGYNRVAMNGLLQRYQKPKTLD